MKYQKVKPPGSAGRAVSSAAAKGKKVGALADAVQAVSSGLMNKAVAVKTQRAIERLEPMIRKRMPEKGGVLLLILVEVGPKGVEFPTKYFKGVYIAGSGIDQQATLKRYLADPHMYAETKDYATSSSWMWVTK